MFLRFADNREDVFGERKGTEGRREEEEDPKEQRNIEKGLH